MSHWSGSILARTPLGYPVTLCHGDPAVSILQGRPLHILQQFFDGEDVDMGQPKALDLGLGGN